MESRHFQLEYTLEGLKATDVPLVNLHNNSYSMAAYADDPGIYYFIPWIAKSFGISLDLAIDLFFGLLLFIPAVISITCFVLFFKHWSSRFVSVAGILLLTLMILKYSDVYITPFFVIGSTIPLFLLMKKLNWTLAFSGLLIGYGNLIRFHAGTGVLLFLVSWILLNKDLLKVSKAYCLSILILFSLLPYAHFKFLENKRDQFLNKNIESVSHPKWHSIYIGLGYLENKYGIQYDDSCAAAKAFSIKPKVVPCSDEYEQILKNECFLLAKTDPIFIIKTVFAKILALLFKALKFANFGLLFCFYIKPSFRETAPFLIAALYYSLPGILTMPHSPYVSGLISLSAFFGIYMICLGLERMARYHFVPKMIRGSIGNHIPS